MAPKKVAAETSTSPGKEAESELMGDQKTDGPDVRKVSAHPSTMEMVKNALLELDQRKGVSAKAISTFIKEKYPTVNEARLKTLVRNALVKGINSGTFVRPKNASTTTGAQGSFRLAVRKPTAAKSTEAQENTNPNVRQAEDAKTGDVKRKKAKFAVEGGKPKKNKTEALSSKVAPAKKPKAKQAAEGEAEPETQKTTKAKGESSRKAHGKKREKATRKTEDDPEGATVLMTGEKKAAQTSEEDEEQSEVTKQKKGGRKAAQKDDGAQNGTRSSGKKGKKAVQK